MAMAPGQVAVVGSINRDWALEVPRLPQPGATVIALRSFQTVGGKGANQAVAAARAGADVRLVAAVGDDPVGDAMLQSLSTAGVDVSQVVSLPGATGQAIVLVNAQGENSIVVDPGTNAALTPALVAASLASAPAGVVLVQGEVPPATIGATVSAGRRLGAFVVLNLAPPLELDLSTLSQASLLVVNESEAEALIGRLGPDRATAGQAGGSVDARIVGASALHRLLGCACLVTFGRNGSALVSDDEQFIVPAQPAEVVDTTGAGDAYVGTLAARLATNDAIRGAMEAATAAAKVVVETRGARAVSPDPVPDQIKQ
jgi:ribokinase